MVLFPATTPCPLVGISQLVHCLVLPLRHLRTLCRGLEVLLAILVWAILEFLDLEPLF